MPREPSVRIIRLEAIVQGIVAGVVCGLGVFLATIFLCLKGGTVVGPHLALLGQFFVGYEVSFRGSLIGLAWGAATGFVLGYVVSSLYNGVVAYRARG